MGRKVSAGVACIAVLALGANAVAAPRCARPDEVTAIQAAMIQQELMVAALTCNEVEHFNAFQTNFGPELRTSDATLARMFMRLYGARRGRIPCLQDAACESFLDAQHPGQCQLLPRGGRCIRLRAHNGKAVAHLFRSWRSGCGNQSCKFLPDSCAGRTCRRQNGSGRGSPAQSRTHRQCERPVGRCAPLPGRGTGSATTLRVHCCCNCAEMPSLLVGEGCRVQALKSA
jgi:hypothetical protein